jgi:hypothetical protein
MTYAGLIEEIKRRVDVIFDVLRGPFALPKVVAVELCYLEIPLVIESFALACIAAHGEIKSNVNV